MKTGCLLLVLMLAGSSVAGCSRVEAQSYPSALANYQTELTKLDEIKAKRYALLSKIAKMRDNAGDAAGVGLASAIVAGNVVVGTASLDECTDELAGLDEAILAQSEKVAAAERDRDAAFERERPD
jgi:hypothetical protein